MEPELRLVKEIRIRKPRQIFEGDTYFEVVMKSGYAIYRRSYNKASVMMFYNSVRGEILTVKKVEKLIDAGHLNIPLKYKYGYKRRYEILDLLTIIHALGLADMQMWKREAVFALKT